MYNCPIIVKAVVTTFKNLIASYAEVIQDIEKRESEVAKLKKEQPTIVRNPQSLVEEKKAVEYGSESSDEFQCEDEGENYTKNTPNTLRSLGLRKQATSNSA